MKKFLVQFEDAPGTRWRCDDEELARQISRLLRAVVRVQSEGPLPSVFVICEEQPETKPV